MGLFQKKKRESPSPRPPVNQSSRPKTPSAVPSASQGSSSDVGVAQVLSALEHRGLHYDPARCRTLLNGRFCHGNPERAVNLALALRDAEDLILVEPHQSVLMQGVENLSGSTCYLDALLFAMYARTVPLFDALLYQDRADPAAARLATTLRLFVNLLRTGHLLTADLVDMLRGAIAGCGWQDAISNGQQDTSECFGFIAEMLQMPTLTFKVHIAHGGKQDASADFKIVQERFLALSVPQPAKTQGAIPPVELVDLMDAYFHSKLEVRRPVARSRSTLMSLHTATGFPLDKKSNKDKEVTMQAWELFELVPYYSATDGSPRQQALAKEPPVVAICLKRYYFNNRGHAVINPTPIIIPEYIDMSSFVDAEATASKAKQLVRLRLESAVCHRGHVVASGHYVSICRAENNNWLLFDDLARPSRITQSSFGELFSKEVPYLLFYQLETLVARPPRPVRRAPSVPNFGHVDMPRAPSIPPVPPLPAFAKDGLNPAGYAPVPNQATRPATQPAETNPFRRPPYPID